MNQALALTLGGLLLLAVGAAIGFFAGRSRTRREVADEAARVRAEHEAYKQQVTEHFRETAVQFQSIGEQYRSLYRHLASGAQNLCETEGRTGLLEFPAPPELTAVAAAPTDRAPARDGEEDGSVTTGAGRAPAAGEAGPGATSEEPREVGEGRGDEEQHPREPAGEEGAPPEEPEAPARSVPPR